ERIGEPARGRSVAFFAWIDQRRLPPRSPRSRSAPSFSETAAAALERIRPPRRGQRRRYSAATAATKPPPLHRRMRAPFRSFIVGSEPPIPEGRSCCAILVDGS